MKNSNYDKFGNWEDVSVMLAIHPNKYIYKVIKNKIFVVQFSKFTSNDGDMIHLWLRRNNKAEISWSEKQALKDALVGPGFWAMEMFPAREDLVDAANMYHLYVFPEGFKPTFGLHTKQESL